MKRARQIDELQVIVIYNRAILVAVRSESSVQRVVCKTLTETSANNAHSVTSDRGLQCLLKLQEFKD